jgi:hypothetical protein
VHEAEQVSGHAIAVCSLCELKDPVCLGMGHDEIERAVLIAMHLGELGVVVRCSANSYASNQSKTAPLGHAYSLAFGFGDESAKIEVTAKES